MTPAQRKAHLVVWLLLAPALLAALVTLLVLAPAPIAPADAPHPQDAPS
ncbi:MAG: hypothetical protein R3B57_06840 [Phycisphaerales bacterium]